MLILAIIFRFFLSLFNHDLERKVAKATVTFRNMSDSCLLAFRNAVLDHNWSSVHSKLDVDDAYIEFLNGFQRLYNLHFPFKTITVTNKIRKPWVTPIHIKMMQKKARLYKSFLTSRDNNKLLTFKKFRNVLTSELRKAKALYYKRMFEEATKKRPDIVWKMINEVLNRSKIPPRIGELKIDGQVMSGVPLAEYFNTGFLNLQPKPYNDGALLKLTRSSHTFFLAPTDDQEIFNIFLGLKNSKSTDVDELQLKPVKFVMDIIVPCLTHIYNLSLSSGKFPTNMKLAKVSVIHKGGDSNVVTNYRPISVLPVFSKALEKIIFMRLNDFFS